MFRRLCLLTCGALFAPLQAVPAQEAFHEPGSIRWFDLLTEDAAAAAGFYGDLFDWELQRQSSGNYVAIHDGELIAGISQIERTPSGVVEATWLVGVVVEDLAASVAAARRRGGEVLQDVTTAEDLAHWAVVEDPQGGQLLLLDPIGLVPFVYEPGPGHLVWTELWTTDVDAASAFYGDVIGWGRGDVEHPDGVYPLFESAGAPRAGLVQIETEEIATGWAPFIGVVDLSETLARARALGGEVLLEPREDIYDGLVAVVEDPTGVDFLLYQFPEVAP